MIHLIYSIATVTHGVQEYVKAQNKYLNENRASVEMTTDTYTAHMSIWQAVLLHSERGLVSQIMMLIELYIVSKAVQLFFIFKFSIFNSYCLLSLEQKIKDYLKYEPYLHVYVTIFLVCLDIHWLSSNFSSFGLDKIS